MAAVERQRQRMVDVRRDVHDAYNAKVDATHARMVWTYPGVETYYKNSRGRVVVNNPFRVLEFWRMTETADLSEYEVAHATSTDHAGAAA